MDIAMMDWGAVALGTVLAFGLGMVWFSPKMFGRAWSTGSHNLEPPESPPVLAMVMQLLATLALAVMVGIAETAGALGFAAGITVTVALFVAGMDLFSQKTGGATAVDAGYVLANGALMIGAQLVL